MSLSTSRIAAVAAVSDMDRARHFYEDTLGLRESGETNGSDEQRMYGCGEHTGLLVYLSPEHAGRSTATLGAWQVDDLEGEMSALRAKGVRFEQYDEPDLHTDADGVVEFDGSHACWVKDPDGNTFAIGDF
ncbi:MAG: VOC family protein [Solirubrobacterales bacterium]|nr:VOC family protein [Solirubrobacterales bacterium]